MGVEDGKEWIMEGHGVDPDIEVENDPAREFLGEDDQLSRGIVEILKLLEINGVKIPPPPPSWTPVFGITSVPVSVATPSPRIPTETFTNWALAVCTQKNSRAAAINFLSIVVF